MSANNIAGEKTVNSHANDLSRQVTLQLSSEQYERLFFQPSQAKGDLSKRLGMAPFHVICKLLTH
jgi:hypothetical protein